MATTTGKRARGDTDLPDAADVEPAASKWWDDHPDCEWFGHNLRIYTENQRLMEAVFRLLDHNGDQTLSREDFSGAAFCSGDRSLLQNWAALSHEFDIVGPDASIGPIEFVKGIKKLAMKHPVNTTHFKVGVKHYEMMVGLDDSLNEAIKNICFALLDTMIVLDDRTKNSMGEAWSTLDVDGDGTLTAADFAKSHGQHHPTAAQKWELIRSKLDKDGDGTITKEEFILQLKHMVIAEIGQQMLSFGSSQPGNQLAPVTTSILLRIREYCEDLRKMAIVSH